MEKSFGKLLRITVNTEAEEDVLKCARIVHRLENVRVKRETTMTPLMLWLIG